MDAGISARPARAQYRHELRTLTYVTLDQANGGIVRNLTHDGIGVQLVAAVRPKQQLRVRFELRYPRLRIETRGEVAWATFSGQCGIKLLDVPPRLMRQIDEWILGNLLEGATLHPERVELGFVGGKSHADDGLLVSTIPTKVIELPVQPEREAPAPQFHRRASLEQDWLSQPLSGKNLVWTVNTLVVTAGTLLFALVFLSVTREAPPWPLAMTSGAATAVFALYWGFFKALGSSSPGARLARLAEGASDDELSASRFR